MRVAVGAAAILSASQEQVSTDPGSGTDFEDASDLAQGYVSARCGLCTLIDTRQTAVVQGDAAGRG